MLKKIERTTLADLIIQQLLGLIQTGELKPGDRVPSEQDLSSMFGVGRTSVREALKALQVLGLVYRQHDGTFVHSNASLNVLDRILQSSFMTRHLDIIHLFEARRVLEGEMWALAAPHVDQETLVELSKLCTQMEEIAGIDYEAYFDLDMRFHQLICVLSGNPVLERMWSVIHELLEANRADIRTVPKIIEQSNHNHRELLRTLALRDASAARQAIQESLTAIEDLFGQALRKGQINE